TAVDARTHGDNIARPTDTTGPPDADEHPETRRHSPDQRGGGYLRAPLRSLCSRPLALPSAPVAPHARRPPPPIR
ncbi:hypothetical protein, partial [Mycobacterium sp.]|uniref:hypothetical protein n=1 Tax=Mycobacterium sp. TaxID=1785 RepID=UPI0031E0FECB